MREAAIGPGPAGARCFVGMASIGGAIGAGALLEA